jgi:hypothetical protein
LETIVLLAETPLEKLADSSWTSGKVWPLVEASFWFAAVFAALAVPVVVVRRWRQAHLDTTSETSDLLSEFRSLHHRGTLSDEEYKKIKSKLAADLRDEIDSDNSAKSNDSIKSVDRAS